MEHTICDHASLKSGIDALETFLKEKGVADEKIFDAKLAARETVENCIRHAGEEAYLSYEISGEFIQLTVRSKTAYLPREITCSSVYEEHGRGLFLIKSVSQKVTVEKDVTKIFIRIKE